MAKWEHINNNKLSHSHLSYSYSSLTPISLSNLIPIPMRIPREGSYPIPIYISATLHIKQL